MKATDKRATFKKAVEEIDEFRIHFMDRDRFTLITVTVKVGDLRRVIDDDREVLGYRANSSDYCVEVLPSGSSTV